LRPAALSGVQVIDVERHAALVAAAMASTSVTFLIPVKAAARSALPASQRSRSWTAWVMTILGIWSPVRVAVQRPGL
jgi:hypothetical protein